MPQVEGGPKGLNSILESAYAAARSSGHDKGTASAIAWSAAKSSYRKKGGKWVEKLYRDLSDIALILQSDLVKSPKSHDFDSKVEHLVAALSKLSQFVVEDGSISKAAEADDVEWVGIDDVLVNPYNRPVDREKVDGIKSAVESSGSVKPLVYSEVDNDGVPAKMITDGHHRHVALKELGYAAIPVRISDENGVETAKEDAPVKLRKEVASADVDDLALVRQDLQAGRKKKIGKFKKIGWSDEARAAAAATRSGGSSTAAAAAIPGVVSPEASVVSDAVAGGGTPGHSAHGHGMLTQLGHLGHAAHRVPGLHHAVSGGHGRHAERHRPDTESKAGERVGAKKFSVNVDFEKGGPGSGSWEGPGNPRFAHAGNKDFAEPFHSGNHVQQFLGSNDVVIGSVDRGNLSPEKNAERQKTFEDWLQRNGYAYKKGQGVSSQWGNEASYIIHAPRKEDAESLHHLLTRQYKQDSVIHVRNGHAVMNSNGGSNEPTRHANVKSNLEAGDHLTDNYTNVDGQKFSINFK